MMCISSVGSSTSSAGADVIILTDSALVSRRSNKEHLLHQKHKYRKKSTARQYHPKQKKFLVRVCLAIVYITSHHLLHKV